MVHILIVVDDEDDGDIFCEAVHELEPAANCILARNGQEALIRLRLHQFPRPEIIFIDLNMNRINGLQCLREIKKDSSLQDIPVVIYTTSKRKEDQEETKALGVVHYLIKPSKFSELCRNLNLIFQKEMILPK